MHTQINKLVSGISALTLFAGLAVAGPLNPPAGAVSPTYKTLAEVEPRIAINATNTPGDGDSVYKITQAGSYYLTGNLEGVSGKCGIEIANAAVTVDLNGFDVLGTGGTLDGLRVTTAGATNVTVMNGSVRGWSQDGIDTSAVVSPHITGVRTNSNGALGINAGSAAVVTECSAYANGGGGIATGGASVVTGCVSVSNTGTGILGSAGSKVSRCTSRGNTTVGIQANEGGAVTDCVSSFNTQDGISVSADCLVSGNTCDGNGFNGDGAGIRCTNVGNRIEGNRCSDADRGIDVDASANFIVRNVCSGNTVNWSIAANNVFGPIIDRTSIVIGAVSGNSASSSLGSTDANANFTY